MAELVLSNIEKSYRDEKVLNNINISMKNGVHGLVGANGAGKTTLMKIICDLLKYDGEVSYNSTNVKQMGEKYREILGYLPQDFAYYPDYTAEEFLIYISVLKGIPKRTARDKATELLKAVDLYEVRKKQLKTYSGGMIRRVGIAQALLNNPKLLILDEPTAGLDPQERIRFRNLIGGLGEDRIVLLSTHIVSDIEYIADEILMMSHGSIVAKGSIESILEPIQDMVWECEFSKEDSYLDLIAEKGTIKKSDGVTKVRFISDDCKIANAVKAVPNLEDAYLYYCDVVSE